MQLSFFYLQTLTMTRKQKWPIWIILAISVLLLIFLFESKERKSTATIMNFGGGPQGSTAQNVAEELVSILDRQDHSVTFRVKQSAGSFTNLLGIEKGKLQFALANAEDSYNRLSSPGSHRQQTPEEAVLLVRLFGTYVQLFVPKSSPVISPEDLVNKRVAIGSSGSDSARCARRYFQAQELWHRITPIYVGYERALQELIDGTVEAVWFMSGVPNDSVREVNRKHPLRLINLWAGVPTSAASRKFYQDFPFYDISVLRPNSYRGQEEIVFTVGMSTLLFANKRLSDDYIYQTLDTIFTHENLQQIHSRYPATEEMGIMNTLTKMSLPMHPGAVSFLRDHL